MEILSKVYVAIASQCGVEGVDEQFIPLSLDAMKNLQSEHKSTMVCGLIRCIAMPDNCGNPTRLPLARMSTGYIEHQINFFIASHGATASLLAICRFVSYSLLFCSWQIPKCPHDYKEWLITMYSQFGSLCHCLHSRPLRQHDGRQISFQAG